jgi:hypothetical protein
MTTELLTKLSKRIDGYIRRIAFELWDRSLSGLPSGLYFTKYPGTQHFSADAIGDPNLKKLVSGLDCLKVAADACYRALGWQKEASLEPLRRGGGRDSIELRPALQFKTRVTQVRSLSRGEAIGYGSTYVVSRPTTIAILPVGYFDGVPRSLSNGGIVLVRGRRARIVGAICMNMSIVDVTDIPDVEKGDEVVLLGRQGENCIGAEEIAWTVGTISYEIVTRIAEHIPRVFVSSGEGKNYSLS